MTRFPLTLALAAVLLACSGGAETDEAASDAAPADASGEAAAPADASGEAPAAAPAAGGAGAAAVQIQETNVPGLVAELTRASREDGVLTVQVRFRNAGTAPIQKNFETGHGHYTLFYVTAGDQKYFVLKDSEGEPLAPRYLQVDLAPGQTMTWWAKFPAPPSSVAEVDLVMPDILPFEDVPVTDG